MDANIALLNAAQKKLEESGIALGYHNHSGEFFEAPVKAVREWAMQNNVRMVIESEGLNPTGPEEVKRCIDFLRTLE